MQKRSPGHPSASARAEDSSAAPSRAAEADLFTQHLHQLQGTIQRGVIPLVTTAYLGVSVKVKLGKSCRTTPRRGERAGGAAGRQVQRRSLRAQPPLVSSSDDSQAKFSERYKHGSRSANTARQIPSHARRPQPTSPRSPRSAQPSGAPGCSEGLAEDGCRVPGVTGYIRTPH